MAKHIKANQNVDFRTWNSLDRTDLVPVKYLPKQPSQSRVNVVFENQVEGGSAFYVLALAVVFLAGGVWTYWYYLSKFSKTVSSIATP